MGVASSFPGNDARRAPLRAVSDDHVKDGLRAVTGTRYEEGHWPGSFAVYLLTNRGLQAKSTCDRPPGRTDRSCQRCTYRRDESECLPIRQWRVKTARGTARQRATEPSPRSL